MSSFDTVAPPYTASDPHATYMNSSCLEFLLIELVPSAYRLASELAAREEEWLRPAGGTAAATMTIARARGSSLSQSGAGAARSRSSTAVAASSGGGGAEVNGGGGVGGLDEEELRESVLYRLDTLGYRVGLGVVERFSRDKPRFADTLDVIKFLCKDLWTLVFRKQIDNLKTNHRGIYVLTDNSFKPLSRMSLETNDTTGRTVSRAQPFLYFPAGLIRGALASMGIAATVTAETNSVPNATFQIRTTAART